jgi:hypothetical protein
MMPSSTQGCDDEDDANIDMGCRNNGDADLDTGLCLRRSLRDIDMAHLAAAALY